MATSFHFYPNLKFACRQIRWMWFFPLPCLPGQGQTWRWLGGGGGEVNLAQTLPPKDYEEREVKGSSGVCEGEIKITFPGRHCLEELMECRKLGSVDWGLCRDCSTRRRILERWGQGRGCRAEGLKWGLGKGVVIGNGKVYAMDMGSQLT